ncbi:hypothetical protein LAX18_23165, partial [Escherichia coli]|nr:hypothetical protein [Escherichia coli]
NGRLPPGNPGRKTGKNRGFTSFFVPGLSSFTALHNHSQAVNALRSILARFCRISCGFHRLRAEIALSAF